MESARWRIKMPDNNKRYNNITKRNDAAIRKG